MNEIIFSLFTSLPWLPIALRTKSPFLLVTCKACGVQLLATGPAGASLALSSLSHLAFLQRRWPYFSSYARALAGVVPSARAGGRGASRDVHGQIP